MNAPKIVYWDLETLPNLQQALKHWPQLGNFPGLTLRASVTSIICFGYAVDDRPVQIVNAWDFPKRWAKDVNDDYELVKRAREVLLDADLIVTHNGKRFDQKHLNTRLVYHGFAPLPPIAHADTCSIAKSKLYMFNNRLNTIGDFFVDEKKMDHEGWDLWVAVHGRCEKAMKKMAAYCKQDVSLLRKVFKKLRACSNDVPNHNLFTISEANHCPSCGSQKLKSQGWRHTKTMSYRRYVCLDCGTYSRTDKHDEKPRTMP